MKRRKERNSLTPLDAWVNEMASLTQAKNIVWCDGSEEEKRHLTAQAVATGVLMPLDQRRRPGCYLHRSHPSDVSRTEELTYVCTPTRDEAGPTNNWMDPGETRRKLKGWLEGAYKGRTMYAVPYVLGPVRSPLAKVGVQLTDSIYVVLSLRIMTRMGSVASDLLRTADDFQRGMHCTIDCDSNRRLICHFPQDNMVWSVGSNYGGNALLSKKCFGLRIASYLGRKEGWLAEHMLILGLESPQGEVTYIAAAFPSACGKTNLAMLTPPAAFKGWRIFTVGDDIAWMRVGRDGRLWAINPEAGYFGVAPGTSARSNPNATEMTRSDTIFTNVALTPDYDVWWEGIETEPPSGIVDWQGNPWTRESDHPAAHPNSRFTCPMTNNPAYTPFADSPEGHHPRRPGAGGWRGSIPSGRAADYETVRLDFGSNDKRKPEYLAINPKGRVPALVTDRGILTETPAILVFVAQSFPQSHLAPLDDAFAFARVQAFNSYLCSTVHVAHAHRMRGYRWVDPADAAAITAMQKKVPQSVAECFDLIDREMFVGPWVMGDSYTICDPYLFTLGQWLEADGVDPRRFPKVRDHGQRMLERTAVRIALTEASRLAEHV